MDQVSNVTVTTQLGWQRSN